MPIVISVYLGPGAILIICAAYLLLNAGFRYCVIYLLSNVCALIIYQQWLVTFSDNNIAFFTVSIGSAAFFITQFFSLVIFAFTLRIYIYALYLSLGLIVVWGLVSILGYGGWLVTSVLTNDFFRVLPGLVLVILFLINKSNYLIKDCSNFDGHVSKRYLQVALSFFLVLTAAGILLKQPVEQIIFDESHGDWETTKSSYGPDDFGRNKTYTYSLLFEYSKKIVKKVSHFEGGDLPKDPDKTLFVIKMPIEPIEDQFILKIKKWVADGGHLLIIGDHTNLFDTTSNLSPLLNSFNGIDIASNANFDKVGNPTVVSHKKSELLFGNVIGITAPFNYMTGASFRSLPISAMIIGRYGQSFVENAIYFKPNRFGYFNPKLDMAFGNHASMLYLSYKKGAVTVIADSTPWSNFAIFRGEYFDLFKSIVDINSHKFLQPLYFYSLIAVSTLLLLLVFMPSGLICGLGLIAFVVHASVNTVVGLSAVNLPEVGKDYHLSVSLGFGAKAENLMQLVPVGEHNFTRALSTFPKYGVIPRLMTVTEKVFDGSAPVNLLINPEAKNLPDLNQIHKYLHNGGRLNIFFDKSQAKDIKIKEWLNSLSMRITTTKKMVLQEGSADSIENRNEIELSKVIKYKIQALQKSHLLESDGTDIYQVFRLQESQSGTSKSLGHLVIGFDSESISDSVIGEVWEGTIPSMLSKFREKQLAMLATSEFSRPHMPIDNQRKSFRKELDTNLKKFIIVKDGMKLMSGDIEMRELIGSVDSLGLDPDFYLAKLSKDVLSFVENNCSGLTLDGFCKENFISHDLIEWVVSFSKVNGKISAVELVHDQRFSGVKSTYNIVFLSR